MLPPNDVIVQKLWAKDASLWTNGEEAKWLGWLDAVQSGRAMLADLKALSSDARKAGVAHVVVLGMGGSSLCPDVFRATFGHLAGHPELHVLDSMDPAQIRATEKAVDANRTWFVVSSKSGSTLEPNILRDYFRQKAGPKQFIAVTDPGSQLDKQSRADGFRAIFAGVPSIGGRFSALSAFGLVPAALMGLDVGKLLDRADAMARACRSGRGNPGLDLGLTLGRSQRDGRDKCTIIAAPAVYSLGAWLEQLIAESTGKLGKAIIPVDREGILGPEYYGTDRLFAHIALPGVPDHEQGEWVARLEKAGLPVVRLTMKDRYDLAAQFFLWEIATAVAGAVMEINPFDQPDVETAKVAARKLTDQVEQTGSLPDETPIATDRGIKLFADERNAAELAGAPRTLVGLLKAHLSRIRAGDYFALQAYVQMTAEHEQLLQQARLRVVWKRRVATTLGFGPRFLHSTGQAHKGGPNTGVFLQVTCDDAKDLPVPNRRYSFGVVKAAQARGDAAVLAARGRRFLRVHLGSDVAKGLRVLENAVMEALV